MDAVKTYRKKILKKVKAAGLNGIHERELYDKVGVKNAIFYGQAYRGLIKEKLILKNVAVEGTGISPGAAGNLYLSSAPDKRQIIADETESKFWKRILGTD